MNSGRETQARFGCGYNLCHHGSARVIPEEFGLKQFLIIPSRDERTRRDRVKLSHTIIKLFAIMLIGGLSALAQTPANTKHFAKDGLSFDYPDSWTIEDQSNSDAQQLTLTRPDSDARIILFAHRGHTSAEKLPDARKAFIDPYLDSTFKSFEQMGAKPERSDASIEVAGIKTDGVRIRAEMDEPGEAGIYWAIVGQRVVVLTFLGPDKALKQATPAWDAIRSSLHIEEVKPVAKPRPK
jgi:hypothetical protein